MENVSAIAVNPDAVLVHNVVDVPGYMGSAIDD